MDANSPESQPPGLRALPPVDALLALPEARRLAERCSPGWVKEAARAALADLRREIRAGRASPENREAATRDALGRIRSRMEARLRPSLRRVINATGIVLHTGLGRAPLSRSALDGLRAAAGYCNLEVDLETGERGDRTSHAEGMLRDLTGAEAAAVVNNNAAAVLLTLNALAMDREVLVSRGQLVEIGGSFRIPEVMARSGARLVEVGTTNRTHPDDFRRAVTERTGLLLSVHPSNYRITGYTAEVGLEDMAGLGREFGLPVAHDLGAGALVDLRAYGLPREPLVGEAVSAGIDVVTFSGDKVMGGPQAGLIVGRRGPLEAIRRDPLMRALRCDKLTYAALEATLRLHLQPDRLRAEHPALRMLAEPVASLRRRARRLARGLRDLAGLAAVEVVDSVSYTGSGALPLEEIPSAAVTLRPEAGSAEGLARRLRVGEVPVVGYLREERLFLDMRTVGAGEAGLLAAAIREAVRSP